ncbi:MAG: nuclear transport factor 2 family protein [Deinococcales bacterium]|nr:nuclear transport factor 2 family protein [Chitinophagaceae bacterium]
MTTQEVADRFNELAQTGQWHTIKAELFADDAESIEPEHTKGMQSVKGMEAIKQKGEMFNSMVEEMHGGYSKKPVVAGTHFSVAMGMDVTMKGMGRSNMDEICVYEVKDGKIVKEQFFY